jgi:hypothetical protein
VDTFGGELSTPDPAQLAEGNATKAENVDLEAPGLLQKQKGYVKVEDAPTGVTIISAVEHVLELPSPYGTKQIKMIHGQDGGGRDEIWWKPYWDIITEAWLDAWQELTEFEGPYTMDAGTTTTDVDDSVSGSLAQDGVVDYYNFWVVMNVTRQATAEVYDNTDGHLLLRDAIAAQASGDTYFVYRFSLQKYIEGANTIDTGTEFTLKDTALLSDIEDYYVGWKLVNTTRSATVTITAYDAGQQTLTHPSVANGGNQANGDAYYIYKDTHDIGVDDVIRFFPRENAIEMSLGNDNGFPAKAPLWFGFITERYFLLNGTGSSETTFVGFWLTRNVLEEPDTTVIDVTDSGAGTLANDTYFFKASYIYDGYQEGPLSSAVSIAVAGGNALNVQFDIPLWSSNVTNRPSKFETILNKRTTHIKLYAAKGANASAKQDYFLILEAALTNVRAITIQIFGFSFTFQIWALAADIYSFTGAKTFDDDLWNGVTFTETGGLVIGKALRWDTNQGHKSKDTDVNFKYRANLGEQHFVAPVFTDIKRDGFISYSIVANSSGVPADDVYPIESRINLTAKTRIDLITGLVELNGYLYIFTQEKTFRFSTAITLIETVQERGLIAPDAVEAIGGLIIVPSNLDIYAFDGSVFVPLMRDRILDQWQAISAANKASAIGGYAKITNTYWIQAGTKIFLYDLHRDLWRTRTTDKTFVWFFKGVDGELFACDADDIFELDSATWDEDLTIDYRTRIIDVVKGSNGTVIPVTGVFNQLMMKYQSDNIVIIEMFQPTYSTTYPRRRLKFFPNSKMEWSQPRDLDFEASDVEFRISDTNSGSQPEVKIAVLKVEFDSVE